jgi:signal transduction histidine kinase
LRIYKENTKLIFSVSDNGIGFNHNQTEELFNKFTKMSKLGPSNEGSTELVCTCVENRRKIKDNLRRQ